MIVAAIDSYPGGSISDRATALIFASKMPESVSRQLAPFMSGTSWSAAEFEISLLYLVASQWKGTNVI
jgi:hypothetical protein